MVALTFALVAAGLSPLPLLPVEVGSSFRAQAVHARTERRMANDAFMAASYHVSRWGWTARAYLAPKMSKPAVEMSAFKTMIASDELTTARVVAQPTPSLPPNVESPQ